ncbi:MAG: hypothetical protein M1827_002800 [Pycnora praestabilis]|nr:MAG: hypothetical protein M1827_002800 [Pycnora praestabilis]
MDPPLTPGTPKPRIYGRIPSSDERRRAPLPRRSTKGPLDVGDPLADPPPSPLITSQISSPRATPPRSPSNPASSSGEAAMTTIDHLAKDFGYLLRAENYHPLSQLDIPQAFRNSSLQPISDTPLSDLLSGGHFRAAAIASVNLLTTSTSPTDHNQIFSLLYTRLSTLTLINATLLAAQEVKILEDLNSSFYHDPITQAHIVPWELRVLAVRLQGVGFGDWRRGVMGYYDLAREARAEVRKSGGQERGMWKDRLLDLGIRVGSALVEMGDLEGAARHLDSLRTANSGEDDANMKGRLALLYLSIGDVAAARNCFAEDEEGMESGLRKHGVLEALCSMAEGRFEDAVTGWRRLLDGSASEEEMITQNLAVSLLYTGGLSEARALLETLIDQGNSFHGLTFNLSTIYELCSEKSKALKLELAGRVASQSETEAGWEKANADFKL